MRIRRSTFVLSCFAIALGSCAAPTLPLPPPTALLAAPDAEGYATVTGIAQPDAHVFAYNDDTEAGVIGRANTEGAYALRIRAESGHVLEVWFMSGDRTSPIVVREVPRAP